MIYTIPLVCLALGLGLGYWMRQNGQGRAVSVLVAVALGSIVWLIHLGRQQAMGWDGLAYGILAMLFIAPAALGLLIGAALSWWRQRR